MKDEKKTKKQPIEELEELRQRAAKLALIGSERKQLEEELWKA
jgi:hypothetical protein